MRVPEDTALELFFYCARCRMLPTNGAPHDSGREEMAKEYALKRHHLLIRVYFVPIVVIIQIIKGKGLLQDRGFSDQSGYPVFMVANEYYPLPGLYFVE